MMPQTMAVITRTFPAESRGRAMSLWGAVAGVATLVGPILGGVLVDGLGWEWIFFVNVPVGVVGLVLAARLVPELPTHVRRFDLLGVVLSAVGMFLLVFGIQEGQSYDWGTIAGPVSVWSLIIAGLVVLAVFVVWQARTTRSRCSRCSCSATATSASPASRSPPSGSASRRWRSRMMLYAQGVLGLSPTQAALLLVPMAVISGSLSPYVGRLTDRAHPRWVAGFGLACFVVGLVWLAAVMGATTPDLGAAGADRAHRRGQRVHVGADLHLGHPQPADEPGGRRGGRLQHHPPDRGGAGQRGHRRAHAGPDRRRAARAARSTRPRRGCPRPCTRASARRWRSRCCCPPRCWPWAWSRRCASRGHGTWRRRKPDVEPARN